MTFLDAPFATKVNQMMLIRSACLTAPLIFAVASNLLAQNLPAFYTTPDITLSPDHRFGVTVPELGGNKQLKDPENQVIEIKTGRVLGVIQSDDVAYDHINNGEIVPAFWSADEAKVLWQVDDKWGFGTIILLSLDGEKIANQVNVLLLLRTEILKRTRNALPEKYEIVKKAGAGDGSWWQDGFAIDCVLDSKGGSLTFPLLFNVFLSSDPKNDSGPEEVNSRMTAEIKADGTLEVKDFHLGTLPPARTWD